MVTQESMLKFIMCLLCELLSKKMKQLTQEYQVKMLIVYHLCSSMIININTPTFLQLLIKIQTGLLSYTLYW